jgi:hypothetical protein
VIVDVDPTIGVETHSGDVETDAFDIGPKPDAAAWSKLTDPVPPSRRSG